MSPTEPTIVGALSPSRAGDFMTCPLLYRFRVVDRLPEPPSPAAVRGTMVHSVLERLYDLPAPERTVSAAQDLLEPQWRRLQEEDPSYAGMFTGDDDRAEWLAQARDMLDRYFTLEDPTCLEPAASREEGMMCSLPCPVRAVIRRGAAGSSRTSMV
ncbi:PD-(D/E)XK nuclease family protein, partial [Streptosporangium sp. NPDC048865]|uniref:RecB family exonuclease n=1 Tax=Streptosporangium sp. NPDC048865 TaxID=3155766 RepID=UPI00344546E2